MKTLLIRFTHLALLSIVINMITGCGVNRFSASTTASYKTPDGKEVFYESNKEHEGVVVESNV